ncbi:MAG: TIGR00266 family protein [Lachnospiraceae bacterium]|nr:TIGR00266 family protein [Lachnospiraceae bacterium]
MQYEIKGEPLPVVICRLDAGEQMICEGGSMSWMSSNMSMETKAGGAGKAFGKIFSGEKVFSNIYTAEGGTGMIAFASSFPGSIRAYEITPGRPIIVQKKAFMASTTGVEMKVYFQKKLGKGFFGGEGFIMQKLEGYGTAFIEIDGTAVEYELKEGQRLVMDTGYLAMMDASCTMDIESVKGVKNKLFGGEGFFNTVVTGPGRVVIQTMPLSKFAATIADMLPDKSSD